MSNLQPPAMASSRGAILMVVLCGAEPRANSVLLEPKFHDDMLAMGARLETPMIGLLPRLTPVESGELLDSIEVPLAGLPYRIAYMGTPWLTDENLRIVEGLLDETALVVLGALESFNMAVANVCRRRGVPYVIVTEYTDQTTLRIIRATTPSPLRRMIREVRFRLGERRRRRMVAGAVEIHAKGYPTYDKFAAINPRRVLFIDTHARAADIISSAELRQRLALRRARRPRLIYSGRYHPMKGTLDIVKVALELNRRGFDFRLDMYGKGPLRQEMESMVRTSGAVDKIAIHDSVPYRPDLQRLLREADLFVSCHVQGDPSCTYLETFACGVPIVGYANEMWTPLCRDSGGGATVRIGDYNAMADAVIRVLEGAALDDVSHRARDFAAQHPMEEVVEIRTSRMAELTGTNLRTAGANRECAAP
jgi:glycosyltransferase involved in cell wall biosynthesis